MNTVESLRDTIAPKSDQLNADDLIAGPLVVRITGIRRGDTQEQPIILEIDGGRQPYKPCKSMRRVMIAAWGDDGRKWVGNSMTLYCDPEVRFGGVKVGGIRISHMTGISGRMGVMLTTTRSKRSEFIVEELKIAQVDIAAITTATDMDALKKAFSVAYKLAKAAGDTSAVEAAYNTRKAVLSTPTEEEIAAIKAHEMAEAQQ